MIINETFMWLYVASKVGASSCVLGVFFTIVSVTAAIVIGVNYDDRDWVKAVAHLRRLFYTSMMLACIGLTVSAVLPSKNDVKAYAAYAIGKDVVTSNEAKALFNTALKYIDGQITEQK